MTETSHRGWLQSVFVFISKTLTFIEIYNKSQFVDNQSFIKSGFVVLSTILNVKKLRCMCVHRISAL